jgi:hypothetical protein
MIGGVAGAKDLSMADPGDFFETIEAQFELERDRSGA